MSTRRERVLRGGRLEEESEMGTGGSWGRELEDLERRPKGPQPHPVLPLFGVDPQAAPCVPPEPCRLSPTPVINRLWEPQEALIGLAGSWPRPFFTSPSQSGGTVLASVSLPDMAPSPG